MSIVTRKNLRSEIIIPSTKLCTVSVSKLNDTICDRYYFWRWIMNLVPAGFNINFWFGSYVHAGIEEVSKGSSLQKVLKAMQKEDKDICLRSKPGVDILEEYKAQVLAKRQLSL